MRKLVLFPLVPFALLFSASVALAEGSEKFTELDANQDGSLSQEEASNVEGLDFEVADSDGNGSLSEEEFKAAKNGSKGEGSTGGMDSTEEMEGETTY